MARNRSITRDRAATISFQTTPKEKDVWNTEASRMGLSGSAFFAYVCACLDQGLAIFLHPTAKRSLVDDLESRLMAQAGRRGREEARLVLIEQGFDTSPYEGGL